jgi:hypothetical protein
MVALAGCRHISHATIPSEHHLVDAKAGAPDEKIFPKTSTNNEGRSVAKAAQATSFSKVIPSAKKLCPTRRQWRA